MDTTQERRGTLSGVLGASTRFDLEATIERELPSDRYADVVALITKLTHRQGEWAEGGNALDWVNRSDVEVLQVAAENKAGATHLRIRADYGAMASFAFFAIVFSVIFLTAAAGGFLFRPTCVVGIGVVVVGGGAVSVAPRVCAERGGLSLFKRKPTRRARVCRTDRPPRFLQKKAKHVRRPL